MLILLAFQGFTYQVFFLVTYMFACLQVSIIKVKYRQHRYFTLKKIRPRVILNVEKGKAREAAHPQQ